MHQTRPINLGSAGADPTLLGLRLWLQLGSSTSAASAGSAAISAPDGLDSAPHGTVVVSGLPDAPAAGTYTVEIFLTAAPDLTLGAETWGPGAVAIPAPSFISARVRTVGPQRIVAGLNSAPLQLVVNTDADPTGATTMFELYDRGHTSPVISSAPATLTYNGASPSWLLTFAWQPDPTATAELAPGWHFGRFLLAPAGGGSIPVPADDSFAVYVAGA